MRSICVPIRLYEKCKSYFWTTPKSSWDKSKHPGEPMTLNYLTFTFMKNDLALSTAGVAVNFNLPSCGSLKSSETFSDENAAESRDSAPSSPKSFFKLS